MHLFTFGFDIWWPTYRHVLKPYHDHRALILEPSTRKGSSGRYLWERKYVVRPQSCRLINPASSGIGPALACWITSISTSEEGDSRLRWVLMQQWKGWGGLLMGNDYLLKRSPIGSSNSFLLMYQSEQHNACSKRLKKSLFHALVVD